MQKSCFRIAWFIAATVTASAQLVSIGVKGGASLLEPALQHDESKRYIVGPSIELRLPANFAVEADALYQRIGNTSPTTVGFAVATPNLNSYDAALAKLNLVDRYRANSWEFPILGKYYLGRHLRARSFVAAGFSLRTLGIDSSSNAVFVLSPSTFLLVARLEGKYRSDLEAGAVFAGGFRYKMGGLSITPEIRYTRWRSNDFITRKNAVSALVGLSF